VHLKNVSRCVSRIGGVSLIAAAKAATLDRSATRALISMFDGIGPSQRS